MNLLPTFPKGPSPKVEKFLALSEEKFLVKMEKVLVSIGTEHTVTYKTQ